MTSENGQSLVVFVLECGSHSWQHTVPSSQFSQPTVFSQNPQIDWSEFSLRVQYN